MFARPIPFVAFGAGAFAQPGTIANFIQVTGVSVGAKGVQVTLKNISPRIITAYFYTVTGLYSDGSEQSSPGGVDEINDVVASTLSRSVGAAPASDRLFRPNVTRVIQEGLAVTRGGAALVSATAEVRMVALDDNTAAGNVDEISSLGLRRKRMMEMESKVLVNLKEVKNSPDPRQRAAELAAFWAQDRDPSGDSQMRAQVIGKLFRMLDAGLGTLDITIQGYEGLVSGLEATTKLTEAK